MEPELPWGLSTSWNGTRQPSLAAAFREIRALGFGRVELYAHYTPQQLEQVTELAREHQLQITSLHSPCPLPVDPAGGRIPLGDWLASPDEAQRRRAVDAIRRTIDTAARLGARAVVVHLGYVEGPSLQEQLFAAIRTAGFGSPPHRELLAQAMQERARRQGPHLEAALKSARELGEHARGTGVVLGLENRDQYFQIPSLEEYAAVFEVCAGLPVGYWHDVGHAQKLENAGFLQHLDYLQRYGDRLVGMHLHDVRDEHDHLAPGQGALDFAKLVPYVRPEVVQTVELSPAVPQEQLPAAIQHLAAAGLAARPPARSAS
ncbi:MAG TPA: sugar phosphate isomerase/epimerase family protein [Chloroflexota bacterium]|nr:sugar phosphate isomerase/epimerase family protein [Chloroflexota bacterium]